MVGLLYKFADFLFPIRRLLLIIFFIAVASLGYLFIAADIALQQQYGIFCLLTSLWSMLLFGLTHSFSQMNNQELVKGFWQKLKAKFINFLAYIYLFFFIALIIASLYFTFKIIRV